mgnify:CR=1 FL=1
MTIHGFFRWLRSLRALNALRDSVEAHAIAVGVPARVVSSRVES